MIKITPTESNERQYEELARAIVIQAAEDYKRSRFLLDTIDLRAYKDDLSKMVASTRAKREIESVTRFFKSSWFEVLSGLDGKRAFASLEKTYENEYFPARMEEFLDSTKQGRYKFGGD